MPDAYLSNLSQDRADYSSLAFLAFSLTQPDKVSAVWPTLRGSCLTLLKGILLFALARCWTYRVRFCETGAWVARGLASMWINRGSKPVWMPGYTGYVLHAMHVPFMSDWHVTSTPAWYGCWIRLGRDHNQGKEPINLVQLEYKITSDTVVPSIKNIIPHSTAHEGLALLPHSRCPHLTNAAWPSANQRFWLT